MTIPRAITFIGIVSDPLFLDRICLGATRILALNSQNYWNLGINLLVTLPTSINTLGEPRARLWCKSFRVNFVAKSFPLFSICIIVPVNR